MGKKCENCGKELEDPRLTHCSNNCLFEIIKNSEKIWKLEYWEPVPHQEPDEQNKIKEHNEIQDDST